MAKQGKTIITIATTGAFPTKELNPAVPLTPEEISDDIYKCMKAGASVAHIHVRDAQGKPTMSTEIFEKVVNLVREKCGDGIILNLTTAGADDVPDDLRMNHLTLLHPEIGSFDCGSINWQHRQIFQNSPQFLEKLARHMLSLNVKPEIEVFDTGMIYEGLWCEKIGAMKKPLHFQFVLGTQGGAPATIEEVIHMKSHIPADATWSAVGIGKGHMPVMYAAVALGGHIRVGMEDNILIRPGVLAKSNEEFVLRAKSVIENFGNKVASVEEAREILQV